MSEHTPALPDTSGLAGSIDQIIGWAKAGVRSGAGVDYYLMDRENVDRMRDDILAAVGRWLEGREMTERRRQFRASLRGGSGD